MRTLRWPRVCRPQLVKESLLPKADRNLSGKRTAMIYKEGVLVREIAEDEEASVYDYNFHDGELRLDESRNSSEYEIKGAAARLFRRATPQQLVPVFKSLVAQEQSYEATFDSYYMAPSYSDPEPEQKQAWQQAWTGDASTSWTRYLVDLDEAFAGKLDLSATPQVYVRVRQENTHYLSVSDLYLDDVQVTALADPCTEWDLDRFYYKGKGGRLPVKAEIEKHYSEKTPNFRAADYEDFRVMLDKEKAIDAVLIATPDHLHAYASLVAMRQGKHTYCEKPLTHNIREARLVAQVAQLLYLWRCGCMPPLLPTYQKRAYSSMYRLSRSQEPS